MKREVKLKVCMYCVDVCGRFGTSLKARMADPKKIFAGFRPRQSSLCLALVGRCCEKGSCLRGLGRVLLVLFVIVG